MILQRQKLLSVWNFVGSFFKASLTHSTLVRSAGSAVSQHHLRFLSLDTNSLGANNHFLRCQVSDPPPVLSLVIEGNSRLSLAPNSHLPVSRILQQLFASPRHSQPFSLRLISIFIRLFVHNLHNWDNRNQIPWKNPGQWIIKKKHILNRQHICFKWPSQ